MEKTRKQLKEYSIVILILTAITLVRAIVSVCVKGLPLPAVIPQGMTVEMVRIVSIISFALTFVFLIPQVYVGLKGMKISDGATCNKAPRVWALVLAILAGIATISSAIDLFKAFNVDQLLTVIDVAVDLLLFTCAYLCLRKIAKA